MSVIAKQVFAAELKERLYDKLTTRDTETVIAELIEQLSNFDIEQLEDKGSAKEFEDLLDLYLNTLRMEGRAESTIKHYRRELMKFHKFDPTPVRHITVFNIRQYLTAEKDRGISDRTLRGNRDVFHSYFGWLHKEGLLPSDPCSNLRPIKCKIVEREPLTDTQLEKLRDCCKSVKEKAMLFFFLSTGCRVTEVVKLNRKDINFSDRSVKVCGKGDKERYVYFTPVAEMYLKEYLDSRTDDSEPLFLSKFNNRMSKSGFENRMKEIGKRAGVKKVCPHRFRHTFATNMLDNGMPIQEVRILMGHTNIDTTQVYAHTSQERVKNSYARYA